MERGGYIRIHRVFVSIALGIGAEYNDALVEIIFDFPTPIIRRDHL